MLTNDLIKPTLDFTYSTMGSGKSTALLQLNFSLKQMSFRPILAKPMIDTRTIGTIKSRIGLEESCILLPIENLTEVCKNSTHILVDEAQFLTRELVYQLAELVDKHDKVVHCYGLRTSYTGELFEGSAALFAIADNLFEIPMTYLDGNKANMHVRYINGKPIFGGNPIHVGDIKEDYDSVSRKEYFFRKKVQ